MYYVYVLRDINGKMYKGMTVNIQRRFNEHIHGKTKTTRNMIYPELVSRIVPR